MLGLAIVRTMLEYNYATQQKLWASIITLDDAQFIQDLPYSHGSIRNHMVHLANVDKGWIRGLQGDPHARANRYEPADYTTPASVRAICEQSAEVVMAYVDTLTEDQLHIHPEGMPLTVWQTLLHVANHGTDHRAQVLQALDGLGAPTFEQDFLFHFYQR